MLSPKPLAVLLFIVVVAPIVLYSERTPRMLKIDESRDFGDEADNLGIGNEIGRGDGNHEGTVGSDKEKPASFRSANKFSGEKSNGQLRLVNSGERKSRVLSASTEVKYSEPENVIEQVTANKGGGEKDKPKDLARPRKQEKYNEKISDGMSTDGLGRHALEGEVGKDQHKIMPDAMIRRLKDQLIRARLYLGLPSVRLGPEYVRQLRVRMKEVERAIGDATKDAELPKNAKDKLEAMEQTLASGKTFQDDCSTTVKKLRGILESTEEQLRVHKKQTVFLTQLAAKTIPKGLHCLPLRLTTEYYSLPPAHRQFPDKEKLEDPTLYHYALFSDNVLAAAVVVNSTVVHAKNPEKHVFHVVTDRHNYAAMRIWFLVNPPGKTAIDVQNVDDFTWLNSSYSPVLRQLSSESMINYYFRTHSANSDEESKFRNPKYLSILNHLRFYLPEVLPKINKVVFLDDDIVVQKDLSALWTIDLKGKVNAAVETCGESFHRFDRYLNFSNPLIANNFDPHACGWAYGMNVFDLVEWKKQNITNVYHNWQMLNEDRQLWKLGTLPPGLITFWNRTYSLDHSWHVLGLGYNPKVKEQDINKAAVIHYNGNMKPWLEIAIPKFRRYWSQHVDYDQVFIKECNINQ